MLEPVVTYDDLSDEEKVEFHRVNSSVHARKAALYQERAALVLTTPRTVDDIDREIDGLDGIEVGPGGIRTNIAVGDRV